MVTEYMEEKENMEIQFRDRKKKSHYWKQDDLERVIVSIIQTLAHLQEKGICHRDLKPANLFILKSTGECKIIDFGESKDYYKKEEDGGEGTFATIRGTP